jgi:hypothetical protein
LVIVRNNRVRKPNVMFNNIIVLLRSINSYEVNALTLEDE